MVSWPSAHSRRSEPALRSASIRTGVVRVGSCTRRSYRGARQRGRPRRRPPAVASRRRAPAVATRRRPPAVATPLMRTRHRERRFAPSCTSVERRMPRNGPAHACHASTRAQRPAIRPERRRSRADRVGLSLVLIRTRPRAGGAPGDAPGAASERGRSAARGESQEPVPRRPARDDPDHHRWGREDHPSMADPGLAAMLGHA